MSTVVQIGNRRKMRFEKNWQWMDDSTQLYEEKKFSLLLQQLEQQGYIFIRNLLPDAGQAADVLLKHLFSKKAISSATQKDPEPVITKKCSAKPGWTVDADTGGMSNMREGDDAIEGWKSIGISKEMKECYDGPRLKQLFSNLFGSKFSSCSECTWIRILGKRDFMVEHADYFYLKNFTNFFSEHRLIPPAEIADFDALICEGCNRKKWKDSDSPPSEPEPEPIQPAELMLDSNEDYISDNEQCERLELIAPLDSLVNQSKSKKQKTGNTDSNSENHLQNSFNMDSFEWGEKNAISAFPSFTDPILGTFGKNSTVSVPDPWKNPTNSTNMGIFKWGVSTVFTDSGSKPFGKGTGIDIVLGKGTNKRDSGWFENTDSVMGTFGKFREDIDEKKLLSEFTKEVKRKGISSKTGSSKVTAKRKKPAKKKTKKKKEDLIKETMLLCDLCDRSFHMACLDPALKAIPSGEWHCDECADSMFDAYTAWVNLSYFTRGLGTLCVLPRAHNDLHQFHRPLPARPDLPRDYHNFCKKSTSKWHRLPNDAKPGDVVLFNVKMVHSTTKNNSNCYCLSLDTRVFARKFDPTQNRSVSSTNTNT